MSYRSSVKSASMSIRGLRSSVVLFRFYGRLEIDQRTPWSYQSSRSIGGAPWS